MPCTYGILTDVNISFPMGCNGFVHIHIDYGLHQVYPTNPEDNFALSGHVLPIVDRYKLSDNTENLYLKGWNEGIYNHTIEVSFTIISDFKPTPAEEAILKIQNILKRLVGL